MVAARPDARKEASIAEGPWPRVLGRPSVAFSAGCLLVLVLGILDWSVGYEISFSIFYLVPITLVVYVAGLRAGLVISAVSAVSWYLADKHSGHTFPSQWIPLWNAAMRLGYFVLHSFFFSRFVRLFGLVRDAALTDSLTGASNARAFYESLRTQALNSRRTQRPFTLAYFDCDNFKAVNDLYGHQAGDEVLQTLVQLTQASLRRGDVFARLGGDEFALLVSGAVPGNLRGIVERVQRNVGAEFQKRGWPVTLSIGAVTFRRFDLDADAMVRLADDLMFRVKRAGKNHTEFTDCV